MEPINIFISYAHDNWDELRSLTAQLDRYIRDKSIIYWTDEKIRAGDKFNKKIYDELKKCDIALFVISLQSVQKFYINKIEIPLAITEANKRGISIIPVYIDKDVDSPVFFRQDILNRSGLPEVNKTFCPVNVFGDKEKIWGNIVEHLDGVINSPSFVKYLEERKSEDFSFFVPDNIRTKMEASIERDKEKELNKWVNNDQSPIAYIEGEEGAGKTILAYQFLNRLSNKGYFTFGFSSIEWQEITFIEEIIKKSFGLSTFDEYNEFFANFEKPIVILLDGVNEKNTLQAYNRIYIDFKRNKNIFKNNVKLLFTTRSLKDYSDFDPKYWSESTKIELGKLSDTEFDSLLSLHGSDLTHETFPSNLIDLAKIPRYFSQALKLKDCFGSFDHVTKALLLWEGLKEQIQSDDKFRDILKITSEHDLENKLIDFILHENFDPLNGKVDFRIIRDIFNKNYDEIKTALQEIRLFENHQRHVVIDTDLVILGYAAYLLSNIREVHHFSIEEIADRGKHILEPFSNDHLSIVPKMAFHLSIVENTEGREKTKIHAALLYLWLFNHNSHPSEIDLYEWADYDLASYVSVLDMVAFNRKFSHRYDDFENYLISLLGHLWKSSKGIHPALNEYLKESLLSPYINEESELQQISTIRRAIIIVHFFPMLNFLDIFVEIYHTLPDSFYMRHLHGYISVLMHLGYKEDYFADIITKPKHSIFHLMFHSHELAEAFGNKQSSWDIKFNHTFLQQLTKQQFNPVLLKEYRNTSQINGFRYFACRLDTQLQVDDLIKVENNLRLWLIDDEKESSDFNYPTYLIEELFSLMARYNPTNLKVISFSFLMKSLEAHARIKEIEYFDQLAYDNEQKQQLVTWILKNKEESFSVQLQHDLYINKIIELLLCTANSNTVLKYFDFLIEKHQFSEIYFKPPILDYINLIVKDDLQALIQKKLQWKGRWLKRYKQKKYDCLMTYLYIVGESTDDLIEWSIKKLSSLTMEKDEMGVYNDRSGDFYRRIIIERSKPSEYFFRIYQNEKLQPFFYQASSSRQGGMVSHWITQEESFLSDKIYDELVEILPFDSLGVLLNHTKRFTDLERWCDQFFTTKTPSETGGYQIDAVLETLYSYLPDKMYRNTIDYLEKTNLSVQEGGRQPLSYNAVESKLIQLLLFSQPKQAFNYYIKSPIAQNIQNKFTNKIFNHTFSDRIHKTLRAKIVRSCTNDLDILYCVNMIVSGNLLSEFKEYIDVLLKSIYAIDRQLAISFMVWIADDESIHTIDFLLYEDDSEYVRQYAQWASHVSRQEKFVKQIYKEALLSEDLSESSIKLVQIEEFVTPTVYVWMTEMNKEYDLGNVNHSSHKRLFFERFFYHVNQRFDSQSSIKVFDRTLKDYFRGETISDYLKFVQKYIDKV
ncbi:MAG: TIR domain-containing protein [Sulfuricurvum sp.]|nr:TIR domain-containing protein [Sulfuricurvum sp.]